MSARDMKQNHSTISMPTQLSSTHYTHACTKPAVAKNVTSLVNAKKTVTSIYCQNAIRRIVVWGKILNLGKTLILNSWQLLFSERSLSSFSNCKFFSNNRFASPWSHVRVLTFTHSNFRNFNQHLTNCITFYM